eukprot:TRINITY_DN9770_c0_g3_i2.p1 TRINITY_DN9770_c0_g3~~TRINITY_DN9770_c0_g3_i2.p1  ORF type:complete len:527 (+),score=53.94 TRINITY_DN9770_c0_g3_i2:37-1581(+)
MDSFRQRYHELSAASKHLTNSAVFEVRQIDEAIQEVSRKKEFQMLKEHRRRPLLVQYMSDGWSCRVRERLHEGLEDYAHVTRSGRLRLEFLLQRGFFVGNCFSLAHAERVMVLGDPRALRQGRSAWNIFQARVEFFPLPRVAGHRGPLTNVYVFDGLHAETLSKRLHAFHEQFYAMKAEDGADAELGLLRSLEIILTLICASHICSNGVKWAMMHLVSAEIIENLHISIESLNRTCMVFHDCLSDFQSFRVIFVENYDAVDDVRMFWETLGVGGDDLDLLAETNPKWNGVALEADARLRSDPACWKKIRILVLKNLKWHKFSETRWVNVRESTALLFRSLAVGVEGLVDVCKRDKRIATDDLNGFGRCSMEVRRYAAVACLAVYPTESFLRELMVDDRVALRFYELENVLKETANYVLNLKPYVFSRLSAIVGADCDPHELRDMTVQATLAGVAFVDSKILKQCREYPWRLAVGDISANLDMMLREPLGNLSDWATLQIRALVGAGARRRLPRE